MRSDTGLHGKEYPVAIQTQELEQGFLVSAGITNFPTEEAAKSAAARLKELVIAACETRVPGVPLRRDFFRETAAQSPGRTEYGACLLVGIFESEALSVPIREVVETTIRTSFDEIVGLKPLGAH